MHSASLSMGLSLALIANTVAFAAPRPLDMNAASAEVSSSYGKAEPEVQEFVLHTARSFGRSGLWLNENAYADLKPADREARVTYLEGYSMNPSTAATQEIRPWQRPYRPERPQTCPRAEEGRRVPRRR